MIAEAPVVVVGAGFFGSTVAHKLAFEYDLPVLLIDKRRHIGGNSYSRIDAETNIEYHVYGSHIFHTSNKTVWDFVNKFSSFNNYRHRVFAKHRGQIFNLPINLTTINSFYGKNLTLSEAKTLLTAEIARDSIADPSNLEEKAISMVGRPLYEAFIENYTRKHWGRDPKDLPAQTVARLPLRLNHDNHYFSDLYEGIPLDGYAVIFERMLKHDRIDIKIGCDYFDIRKGLSPGALIVFTGPVDSFYQFQIGKLGWRTLDLELERAPVEDFQGTAVINYPDNDVTFTRIHEFKHYHPETRYETQSTLLMYEYPKAVGPNDEPYYPINTANDRALYQLYKDRTMSEERTVFGGRLGTYRYLDMHQAIGAALRCVENEIVPRLRRLGHL